MTALERALRHIEQLMSSRAPTPRKPAKRRTAPKKKKPRVVARVAGHTRLREPYNPTPDPVDQVKLAELQAVIAPPPVPPFEWSVTAERTKAVDPLPFDKEGGGTALEPDSSSPTAKSQTTGGSLNVRRANCRAVDAKTGLVCKLGVHTGDVHGHERGRFHVVATQAVRRAVDDAAWRDAG